MAPNAGKRQRPHLNIVIVEYSQMADLEDSVQQDAHSDLSDDDADAAAQLEIVI